MTPEEVRGHFSETLFSDIRWVEKTESTNSDLIEAARRSGGNHGSVLVADYQSAGRGRSGRAWTAEAGTSLLASVLLEPAGWKSERVGLLTWAMALSALEACESFGACVRLKWPNDLLGFTRSSEGATLAGKLGGVLAETTSRAGVSGATGERDLAAGERNQRVAPLAVRLVAADERDLTVVVGLGLNLNWSEALQRMKIERRSAEPNDARRTTFPADRGGGQVERQAAEPDDARATEEEKAGVLLGNKRQALPPVSLNRLLGRRVDRNEILLKVLENLERWYGKLDWPDRDWPDSDNAKRNACREELDTGREGQRNADRKELDTGREELLEKVVSRLDTLGRRVRLITPGGEIVGRAVGISCEAHLMLETDDEQGVRQISAGDCVYLRHDGDSPLPPPLSSRLAEH